VFVRFRAFALLALLSMASPAWAHDYKLGALEIGHPWSRATPPSAPTGAGYLSVKNTGTTPDRLLSVSSPAAGAVQVHDMKMDGSVMRMRELDGPLEIKPGETVTLKPGGFHMMLVNLKHPLEQGNTVKATLKFDTAGTVDVDYPIAAIGAAAPGVPAGGGTMMMQGGGGMNMDHGGMQMNKP
jgi:periplasmic copper chaperone A